MNDAIAYFITWTTYGTWLPGDSRGWVLRGTPGVQTPDPRIETGAREAMIDRIITLTPEQRHIVDSVIVQHCHVRNWLLHARNVRTNHVHVVVSAVIDPRVIREQLKAWGSRRLSEHAGLVARTKHGQRRWWTEKGDIEFIRSEERLADAIRYVMEMQ